jgi:hypothetical protein
VGEREQGKCRSLYIFVEKEMKIFNWEQDFCTSRTVSEVEFVSDKMKYVVKRGH